MEFSKDQNLVCIMTFEELVAFVKGGRFANIIFAVEYMRAFPIVSRLFERCHVRISIGEVSPFHDLVVVMADDVPVGFESTETRILYLELTDE